MIAIAFSSCSVFKGNSSNKQVRCPKPKKNVSKKFSTKRKARNRTASYGGGGGGSSARKAPVKKEEPIQTVSTPEPEPEPVIEEVKAPEPIEEAAEPEEPSYEIIEIEDAPVEEERVPTIAESKDTSFEDEPSAVVEFRGQEIDLEEEDFKYDEPIEFIDATDYFFSRENAVDQLKDLSKLLKENKNIEIVVIGNTATTYPEERTKYGKSNQVLDQKGILNTEDVTIREVMLARAQRVHDLLVARGVSSRQLSIETGEHFPNKRQRVVTFLIRTKK